MSPAYQSSQALFHGMLALLALAALQTVGIDPVGSSLNVLNAIVPFIPEDVMNAPIPYDELARLS